MSDIILSLMLIGITVVITWIICKIFGYDFERDEPEPKKFVVDNSKYYPYQGVKDEWFENALWIADYNSLEELNNEPDGKGKYFMVDWFEWRELDRGYHHSTSVMKYKEIQQNIVIASSFWVRVPLAEMKLILNTIYKKRPPVDFDCMYTTAGLLRDRYYCTNE